jgi:alpha-beta hydrolase superfamily lysophospholipase
MTERRTRLRPVREVTPTLEFVTIHGYRRAYRVAGSGPALLLIHGIGDNSTTWNTVHAKLAQRFTVIAPDLLGHGQSDKPRADYSVAAYANGMRDLLSVPASNRSPSSGTPWAAVSPCSSPTSSRTWSTG